MRQKIFRKCDGHWLGRCCVWVLLHPSLLSVDINKYQDLGPARLGKYFGTHRFGEKWVP